MSKIITAVEPQRNETVNIGVKAFLRGSLAGDTPTVTFVVSSQQGEVLAHFDATPKDAHIFSEYVRQEAELASVAEEEMP